MPILNLVVLLQLAGLSPWLVLLAFVPFVNIAFLVVFAIALYRVSVAFGFGAGMTVVGVPALPGVGVHRRLGKCTMGRTGCLVPRRRSAAASAVHPSEAPGLPPAATLPRPARAHG